MKDFVMLQLVYISSSVDRGTDLTEAILATSRRNNARDGITGLLYADGTRFLQVLEGEPAKVEAAFARIKPDVRHRGVVVLSRRTVATREFGAWDMAARAPNGDGEAFVARIDGLLANASPSVRGTFEGLAAVRRAA
jgi:hypothetical protein